MSKNSTIPYINLKYNPEKLKERAIQWKEIKETYEEFKDYPDDDPLHFQPWTPISKKTHTHFQFVTAYPRYSAPNAACHNIILEEDDPNLDTTGIYMTHLNGRHDIEDLTDYRLINRKDKYGQIYCYGVADNATQVKKHIDECIQAYQQNQHNDDSYKYNQGKDLIQFMQKIEKDNREYGFILLLTPIVNKHNNEYGGWRWGKWDPYIGKHNVEYEYLNHEKNIDFVFVWRLYAVIKQETETRD